MSYSGEYLRELMRRYRTDQLVGTDPAAFRKRIDAFLQIEDHAMEGFADPQLQRDLTVKFHWGHDHDFGDFALAGRMGSRHINLLATFIDDFGALPRDLTGKRVFDIGCWTGGTSLLMSAMGASSVVAIEEVRKYVECVQYLKSAFGVKALDVQNRSLYESTGEAFQDAFDFALFAGVLYHVTDPVLALRVVFNSLRDGGKCLLETLAIDSNESIVAYQGPQIVTRKSEPQKRSRGGWNWFVPSQVALAQMMRDVGFVDVRVELRRDPKQVRAFAVGKRESHVDMMRGGLSVRNIR